MKRPDTTPCGEPGPAKQKARRFVWPRHHLWLVVGLALAPAVTAAPATTPAVISNVVVVPTAAAPPAAPAPAAAAPAVSAWAKTPAENAIKTKPNASFFILAPLNDQNAINPVIGSNYAGEKP
jgi:hypothetical protein